MAIIEDKKFCKKILADLVNIESVSGREENILKYLERISSSFGLQVKRIPKGARRSNLIISVGRGKPILCLNAHADTVPPSGKSQPKTFIKKGRLYGLGASDDKGPLVSALCAFKNIVKDENILKGRADLFISIGEERGGEGTELGIKRGYKCNAAVTCESTSLNIGIAQSGAYFIKLVTKGKSAHGSKPWEGKNAIWEMIALINEIKKIVRKGKRFRLTGPASLNLGVIKGGDIPNRVPDTCTAKIDIRIMPGEDVDSFKDAVKKIFKIKRWRNASCTFLQDKEPMAAGEKDILVNAMSRAARMVKGKTPECLGIRGWTEAGNFNKLLKVPAIIFGPGTMEVAHSQNEWIALKQVYQAAKIYELFIKQYFSATF